MKKLLLALLGSRRWALTLATILSLGAMPAVAQSNECATATDLIPGAAPAIGTTAGSTQSIPGGTTCGGIADDDVWYRFVATNPRHAITVNPSQLFDVVVDVRSGSCPGTNIACANSGGLGVDETVSLTGLTVGTAYYVRLYSFGLSTVNSGSYTIYLDAPTTPANDDPTGATVLTVGATCNPTSSTTVDANFTPVNGYTTPSTSPNTCGTAFSPRDVWFKFTTLPTQTNAIVTVNGTAAGQIRVFSASSSAGPFTQVGCAGGTGNFTQSAPLVLPSLASNTTYYVSVAGYGNSDIPGPFTICVTGAVSVVPPNDNPSGATVLPMSSTCVPVTSTTLAATTSPTSGYTNSGNSCSTSSSNLTPQDVWFTFTTLPGQTSATVMANGSVVGRIRAFSALSSTGPFSEIACSAGSSIGQAPPLILTGVLTGNTTYYVSVASYLSTDAQGSFTICVTGSANPGPAGNECASATLLTSSATCMPVSGTTVGATQSLAAIACGGLTGTADDDVWYRFVATTTAHTITVAGTGLDAVVDVRGGTCPGTTIDCANATGAGGTEVVSLTGLTVGSTYYVRVYSFGAGAASAGTFTICVTNSATATCANPTDVQVASVTSTTAQVTFTPATGNTGYLLTYTPNGGATTTVTPNPTTSPVTIAGLSPATLYTLTFQAVCGAGSTAPVLRGTFTTLSATGLVNDNPVGAIALPMNSTCVTTNATNLGATTTVANGYSNPASCGNATSPKDVWFKFTTVTGQTNATVAVTGIPAGQIRVFSAPNFSGPFTQIRCAAGTTNNTASAPAVLTGLTGNTTYYVAVAGYGSNDGQGAFTICVTGAAAAPCNSPTNVQTGSITATGAQVSFTQGTNNTNYTVTCTSASGTTTTATGTTSPIILAGLTASTVYTATLQAFCANGGTAPTVSFTFTTPAVAPPANDNPTGATALTVSSTCAPTSATNVGATTTTANGYANPGTCGVAVNPKDVWFRFVTLAGQTAATVTVSGNAAGLVRVFSASSNAGPFTEVGCTGATANNTVTTPVNLTGLTGSTTYYVSVSGVASNDTQGAFTICVTGTVISVPANNECTGAILLTSGTTCVPTSGTTVGATQSLAAIACGGATGVADDDVWYRFVATTTAHTVMVASSTIDAVIDVRAGTCPGTNIGCADAMGIGGPETVALTGLTVGSTYYVRVYSYGSATTDAGTFTICVTNAAAPTCTTPTNAQATATSSTTAQVTFTPLAGNTSFVLTYTPAGGAAVTTTATTSPVNLTGLAPNTTYTLTIQALCAAGGTASVLSGTFTTPASPGPANNECAAATLLTSGTTCVPTSGTTVGATQSLAAIACNSFTGSADDDVWYRFVATAAAHTVTVAGSAALDAVVDVRSGTCPGTNIGCADTYNAGGTEVVTLAGLTVGQTYYVRVYSYGAATTDAGTFTICVTNGAAATCANPTDVTFGTATNTSMAVTFTPVAGNTSYIVTYTPANGPTTTVTPAPTSSPAIVSGLTPGTFYTLTFQAVCANGGTAPLLGGTFVTTTTGLTPPANDNPSGATTLTVTSTCAPTSATNLGATITAPNGYPNPGTCGVAANPKDVWFKFTTLTGQTAATLTVGGNAAGLVRVFAASSSAGPFAEVGCSGAATNNTVTAPVSLTGLTGNTTYYVSVSGASSNDTQGAFTICVTGTGTAPTCPAVTGLSTGNPTATTNTLTFTPVAAAVGYTVTLTPAGGNPVTIAATGSPVALTGLTPGTSYAVCVTTICSAGGTAVPACIGFNTPVAPCPAVTDQAVSNITPTSASVTFTPVAGAVNYTISYTPQGGTTTTFTVSGSPVNLPGLLPSTQYTVVIRTNCAAGQSSSDATLIFPTATPCAAVTNLAAGSISATGATLTFTPPATGATFFTIAYTPAGGNTITQNVAGSPMVLTGLLPGTVYTATVITDCGLGRTSPVVSTTFTTPAAPVCNAATNIAVGNITPTSAGVSFTPAAGAVGYTLAVTPAGGSTTTLAATGSPVALSSLLPGTTYTVTIVTNCATGQTSGSVAATFTTPFAPCLAITGLAATSLTGTSASLTFTPATSAVGYAVTVTPQGGTASSQTATGSPVALSGLLPGTTYTASVVTTCTGSQTSTAVATTFTTPAPAPTNGTAGSITDTGVSISFTPVAGATSYTVTYTSAGGIPITLTITGSPVVLTGLLAGTGYTVTIVANYPGGGTSAPLTTTFTTLLGTATRAALAGGMLTVFPNPAHRAFTLSLPALGATRTARLTLVNALGQTVRSQTIALTPGGTQTQVEVADLSTGLYTVRVQAGAETATTRLAVE
jgi:hypothetical protein